MIPNLIKYKLFYLAGFVIFVLVLANASLLRETIQLKKENNRVTQTMIGMSDSIHNLVDKDNTKHQMIRGLKLERDEFKQMYGDINKELINMRLKLKNIKTITKTDIQYVYEHDTLLIEKHPNKYQYQSNIVNPWFKAKWKSEIDSATNNLMITEYQTIFYDSLMFVTETVYKGWWFWRKPKYTRIHIKSKNPYSKINELKQIEF